LGPPALLLAAPASGLAGSPKAAALGALVAALLDRATTARRLRPGARRSRAGTVHRRTAWAGGPAGQDALEDISAALELAERTEDYEEAARLRDQLRAEEAARPMAALLFRQRRQVQSALEMALFNKSEPLKARLQAIEALAELALPPAASADAEDALHRVLREASGEDVAQLQDAAESALWSCWHRSGEEEVDVVLRRGMQLMENSRMQEAVQAFTEVIETAPRFAEGWNKRATAFYMLRDFDKSIDDCAKVLELKPRHFGCLSGLGMCHKGRGDDEESLKWFKAALEVYPGMRGPERLVLNALVQEFLAPRVGDVVDTLNGGEDLAAEAEEGLACSWDVHRVKSDEASAAHIYFLRVTMRNEAAGPRLVRSLARFYVLQFVDGHVFPFTRLTEGAAGYTLRPGEEYRFCWALIVGRELRGLAGGALLERGGGPVGDGEGRHVRPGLEPALLLPEGEPQVPMKDVERLGQGYFYTGQLDLRQIAGL